MHNAREVNRLNREADRPRFGIGAKRPPALAMKAFNIETILNGRQTSQSALVCRLICSHCAASAPTKGAFGRLRCSPVGA